MIKKSYIILTILSLFFVAESQATLTWSEFLIRNPLECLTPKAFVSFVWVGIKALFLPDFVYKKVMDEKFEEVEGKVEKVEKNIAGLNHQVNIINGKTAHRKKQIKELSNDIMQITQQCENREILFKSQTETLKEELTKQSALIQGEQLKRKDEILSLIENQTQIVSNNLQQCKDDQTTTQQSIKETEKKIVKIEQLESSLHRGLQNWYKQQKNKEIEINNSIKNIESNFKKYKQIGNSFDHKIQQLCVTVNTMENTVTQLENVAYALKAAIEQKIGPITQFKEQKSLNIALPMGTFGKIIDGGTYE